MSYLVTIAVPIYGVEMYIERCVRSIFEQTYHNLDILFINDCTKDNSIQILHKVCEEYPLRKKQIRIINHPQNYGLAVARNTAIKHSRGEFIFHIDSDDYLENTAIEDLVHAQIKKNADIVFGNYLVETIKENKIVSYCDITKARRDIIKDCLSSNCSHNIWGILIKKTLYTENDIKTIEGVNYGEDWQVTPLLLFCAKHIDYINKITYHYDLSRTDSYTAGFSQSLEKKIHLLLQLIQTTNHLIDFFFKKDIHYLPILYNNKSHYVQDAMIFSCRLKMKKTFDILAKEMNSIPTKYLNNIGKNNFIFRMMKKNYYCFYIIIKLKTLLERKWQLF